MTARLPRTAPLLALALLACTAPARAQLRPSAFSVGGRVHAAIPLGSRGEGLDAGTGFGIDAAYELGPGFLVYLGFSRTSFPVSGAGGTDRVDSGVDVGILTQRPVGGIPLRFRAGLVLHEAETHEASAGGDGLDDGKTGVGLESGIGVLFRLGRRLDLVPGVTHTAYTRGAPGGVTHLRAELTARLRP